MKKINLLVTGPTLTSEDCSTGMGCRYDFSFLLTQPSMLIWSDNIVLTTHCFDHIHKGKESQYGPKMGNAIQVLFDIAKEYDMLEIKNPDTILTQDLVKKIDDEIERDREILVKLYPDKIRLGDGKSVPGEIFVENNEFCSVILYGVYGCLVLAKEWEAESLFSQDVYDYCKYKFGMSLYSNKKEKIKSFNNIFNVILPEQELFPYYALDDLIGKRVKHNCGNCKNTSQCDKNFVIDLDNNVRNYLELRENEEIQQIKGVLQDITLRLERGNPEIDHYEIIQEFRKQERIINRDLKIAFPKIRRWTYLGLVCSSPLALLGTATGLPIVTYAGASAATICGATTAMLEYSENKYKWVGFIQRSHGKY
jgi:hypothetical protein